MISRIYLDCGEREGRGMMARSVAAMAARLQARGYDGDQLLVRVDPHGRHAETSWRRRMPRALRFMYR
jgi:hypothetical protein